jgi:hypothetical protein
LLQPGRHIGSWGADKIGVNAKSVFDKACGTGRNGLSQKHSQQRTMRRYR